jgi:hypothetical protein
MYVVYVISYLGRRCRKPRGGYACFSFILGNTVHCAFYGWKGSAVSVVDFSDVSFSGYLALPNALVNCFCKKFNRSRILLIFSECVACRLSCQSHLSLNCSLPEHIFARGVCNNGVLFDNCVVLFCLQHNQIQTFDRYIFLHFFVRRPQHSLVIKMIGQHISFKYDNWCHFGILIWSKFF